MPLASLALPCSAADLSRAPRQYGNSENDDHDDGCGTMEAIYFGNAHWHGNSGAVTDPENQGPWVGADLEQGMYCTHHRALLPLSPAALPEDAAVYM